MLTDGQPHQYNGLVGYTLHAHIPLCVVFGPSCLYQKKNTWTLGEIKILFTNSTKVEEYNVKTLGLHTIDDGGSKAPPKK